MYVDKPKGEIAVAMSNKMFLIKKLSQPVVTGFEPALVSNFVNAALTCYLIKATVCTLDDQITGLL